MLIKAFKDIAVKCLTFWFTELEFYVVQTCFSTWAVIYSVTHRSKWHVAVMWIKKRYEKKEYATARFRERQTDNFVLRRPWVDMQQGEPTGK
jgi:hypothetical protein